MSQLIVHAGDFTFQARFEERRAQNGGRLSQGDAVRKPGDPCPLERRGGLDAARRSRFRGQLRKPPSYPAPGQIISIPAASARPKSARYGGRAISPADGPTSPAIIFITPDLGAGELAGSAKTVL